MLKPQTFTKMSYFHRGDQPAPGERAHGHLQLTIADALLLRGTADFDDLAAYRGFIDEIVSRRNARGPSGSTTSANLQGYRIAAPRTYQEVIVRGTSSGGLTLRKVFYTVPSRQIGHQLRVRLYDRLDVFVGGSHLVTLPRGRPQLCALSGQRNSPATKAKLCSILVRSIGVTGPAACWR